MFKLVFLAIISGIVQYLILSAKRIYRELIDELLPQLAEENQHNVQFDVIRGLLDKKSWRMMLLVPIAFLCTFILLPYDLEKVWEWIERNVSRLLNLHDSRNH